MSLFKPAVLSPKEIDRRDRIRAKGRKHYIFYDGALGWGGFMFVVMTCWQWHDKFGWHVPSLKLIFPTVFFELLLWSVAGYVWGELTWQLSYAKFAPKD